MTAHGLVAEVLIVIGAGFFMAGTVGLLRFPDVYTRLHALTKADNLGLGFVVCGLAVESGSVTTTLKLGLVWASVLLASGISSQLIARAARRSGIAPRTDE